MPSMAWTSLIDVTFRYRTMPADGVRSRVRAAPQLHGHKIEATAPLKPRVLVLRFSMPLWAAAALAC